ncbi:hypothetical protein BJ170DRAFT_719935 [Xylariales sp. AK1849]|nr:hypothetical protein BJ170DRAFT_719935 [Xylariales sp. AK1849]
MDYIIEWMSDPVLLSILIPFSVFLHRVASYDIISRCLGIFTEGIPGVHFEAANNTLNVCQQHYSDLTTRTAELFMPLLVILASLGQVLVTFIPELTAASWLPNNSQKQELLRPENKSATLEARNAELEVINLELIFHREQARKDQRRHNMDLEDSLIQELHEYDHFHRLQISAYNDLIAKEKRTMVDQAAACEQQYLATIKELKHDKDLLERRIRTSEATDNPEAEIAALREQNKHVRTTMDTYQMEKKAWKDKFYQEEGRLQQHTQAQQKAVVYNQGLKQLNQELDAENKELREMNGRLIRRLNRTREEGVRVKSMGGESLFNLPIGVQ